MAAQYVGKVVGGKSVRIGQNSPNGHILITGLSGSGKSVRIADIENHIVETGETVIAFDINGTHPDISDKLVIISLHRWTVLMIIFSILLSLSKAGKPLAIS